MAITTTTNYGSLSFQWATADGDVYSRANQLQNVALALESHDHSSGKGLGVLRIQTTAAPASAGQVRVNGDSFQWWGSVAAAVQTALTDPMTTAGDLPFRNAGNTTTRLPVGTSGQLLASSGSTLIPTWTNTLGPAYSEITSAAAGVGRQAHWFWAPANQTLSATSYPFAGTGPTIPTTGSDATVNKYYLVVTSGVLTAGMASVLSMQPTGVLINSTALAKAADNLLFKAIVWAATIGDGTGGQFDLYAGFRADGTTGQSSGIYFRATSTGATVGNWFLVCRSAGVETTVDMGIAPALNAPKLLELRVSGAGTSVQGYIDGVSTGAAITTNIPTVKLIPGVLYDVRTSTITSAGGLRVMGMGAVTNIQ